MHSTTVLPHKMAIVLRPQICDVISPYVLLYFKRSFFYIFLPLMVLLPLAFARLFVTPTHALASSQTNPGFVPAHMMF